MTQLEGVELQKSLERGRALQGIQQMYSTLNGRALIKHLFRLFMVGELPQIGLQEAYLRETLGELRSGKKFLALVSEADPMIAASILAEIEKENIDEMAIQNSNS